MKDWGFETINRFTRATPWLHAVVLGYATFGILLFAALLIAGWWIGRRRGDVSMLAAVGCAGLATLLAVAINQPIVAAVHEARPYVTHPGILVLASRSTDYSFPSDHAVMAGAAATGLWLASRRLGLIAGVAAIAMAFSRVYIAAHYPQDVIAGLLVGGAIAVLTYLIARATLRRVLAAVGNSRLHVLVRQGGPAQAATSDANPSELSRRYPLRYEMPATTAESAHHD